MIPKRILDRPPTAELRPDQKDEDCLPPYALLDPILKAYVEEDRSVEEIVAMGIERAVVLRVIGLVDRSEYKRRQAPVRHQDHASRVGQGPADADHERLSKLVAGY